MEVVNAFITAAAASPWLLLVLFAAAVIDGFFPPVPSETVLVAAAAVAVSTGSFPQLVLLCLVAAAGAMIGDNIAYTLGRAMGTTRFRWMRRPKVAAVFARARQTLDERGAVLILGARYIPVGRVAVNMSAGAVRYPRRRFVPLSGVAAIGWAASSAAIGVLAASWLGDQPVLSAALAIVAALTVGLAVDRTVVLRRRRRAAAAGNERGTGDPAASAADVAAVDAPLAVAAARAAPATAHGSSPGGTH
ncbi:DedA family protein [Microbacterium sp. TNHR37B]|uniref:DedA family protein n=1 Tax=Microbacterium sp. TNHR37B TaxID=1775956 RepID=UPI0007B2F631|nr:DedA family protein [Microbacterium sp. TNHR37B]KZE90611.1 putative membrane protein [Microbacterium sp. TNHR37B]